MVANCVLPVTISQLTASNLSQHEHEQHATAEAFSYSQQADLFKSNATILSNSENTPEKNLILSSLLTKKNSDIRTQMLTESNSTQVSVSSLTNESLKTIEEKKSSQDQLNDYNLALYENILEMMTSRPLSCQDSVCL